MLSGVAGAASFAFLNAGLFAPLIGASGAVAGMVGAVCFYSFVPSDPSNPMPFQSRQSTFGFIAMWVFLNFVLGALPPETVGLKGGAILGKHISAVSYSDCSRRKPLTVADCHQIRLNSGRQHL